MSAVEERLLLQGYAQPLPRVLVSQGYVSADATSGGGLDTARGRMTALVEPWAVVIPDGEIDAGDRAALLGQYAAGGGGGPILTGRIVVNATGGTVVN